MSISELCTTFTSSNKLKDDSERNIIEFAEAPWGLGLGSIAGIPPLFPVQRFIFKCYYNIPLDNTNKNIIVNDKFNEKERFRLTELEYLDFLWNEGRINVKEVTGDPAKTRPNLCLVIGRRGLKTSSIAVLVAYETYKLLKKMSPQEYYKIMPDDEIRVSCIATNMEQASELFRRISGHLERCNYFKKYRNKPTLSYMQLNTQRDLDMYTGKRPSIRLVAAPCSGRGIRGHNNIIAVLDEIAYFFESDTSDDKSDDAIYNAVTPSTASFTSPDGNPDGRIISISSPGARTGKFFEIYQRSMEKDCDDILMIQAPTWEVNPSVSPKFLRAKYMEKPHTFMNEYGAQFTDRVSAWIENEQVLRMNVIPGLKEKKNSMVRTPHFMGVDIGLKNDGTSIVIAHIEKMDVGGVLKDFIEIDLAEVRYASEEGKEFFHPQELADWIASYNDKFFIVKGVMDQYYGLSIIPALQEKNMKQLETVQCSRDYNSKVYQNLMSKMLDGTLRIPEGDSRLINGRATTDHILVSELLKLQATQFSKYMISVAAPEIQGYHDDLSDAFARAVYLATEYMSFGATVNNNIITSGSVSGLSYKQYYMKQKSTVYHTKRPSSSLQSDLSRGRSIGNSLSRIATPLGSRGR